MGRQIVFANAAAGVVGMANAKPPRIGTKAFACFEHFLATDNPAVHTDAVGGINADGAKYVLVVFEFDFVKIL
tara:strand:+ start:728 stop:946 length:219 start_codon:yes stop_codon:yes gene_type:complete